VRAERLEGLIDVVPKRYHELILLVAGTGTRQGEGFSLCIDRIDFLRKTVDIDQQVIYFHVWSRFWHCQN
jgi:hypothetical protein